MNNPSLDSPSTKDIERELLKSLVSSFYQIQKVRIQIGNKLTAHFYRKLGIDASETLVKQQQGDKKTAITFMDALRTEFRRITDAFSQKSVIDRSAFKKISSESRGVFSEYVEYSWMHQYRQVLGIENEILKDIAAILERFPIYTEYLTHIKGVGPTIAAVLISIIDIHKSETPAALWKLAGVDVVITNRYGEPDGRGRGKFRNHLIERDYVAADGSTQQKDSVTFNPHLKTMLCGVMADVMIKHRTPKYRDEYDNYKNRIVQRENQMVEDFKREMDYDRHYRNIELKTAKDKEKLKMRFDRSEMSETVYKRGLKEIEKASKAAHEALEDKLPKRRYPSHIHRMAIRYMVKRFLVDYYKVAREMEGLPLTEEYGVRKLGYVHHTATSYHQGDVHMPPPINQEPFETPTNF